MFALFKEVISELDQFHYEPRLGFKAKPKQGTFLGGVSTVIMGSIIFYIMGNQLHILSEYKQQYHKSIETVANLTEVGTVKLDDMGTLPFYSVHYKGHQLPRNSEKQCKGDC